VLASGLVISDIETFNGAMPALFQGTHRVFIQGSGFLDNSGGAVSFEDSTNTMTVSVDSTMFRGTNVRAHHLALLDVRHAQFQGSFQSPNQEHAAIVAHSVRLVSLFLVDLGGLHLQPDYSPYGGPFGVDVTAADSLDIRHVSMHDNPFGAVICRACRAVAVDTSEFLRNGQFAGYLFGGTSGTVVLEGPASVRVHAVRIDGGGGAGLWLLAGGRGGSFRVDSSAFVGDWMSLVRVDSSNYLGTDDTLLVNHSQFSGHNHGGYGVEIRSARTGVTVTGSSFDSTTVGVSVTSSGATTIRGNTFTGVGQGALQASSFAPASPVVFDSNTVTCADPSASDAIHLNGVGGSFTGNTLTHCLRGFSSNSSGVGLSVLVFGNTVSRDSAYASNLVDIAGPYDSVTVARNIVVGGRGTGVNVMGQSNAVRVDSNVVQGIFGNGIVLGGFLSSPVRMTYNLIADNDTDGLMTTVPVVGRYNTVVRNKRFGAYFASTTFDTLRLGNYVGNGHYGVMAFGPGLVVADSSYWGRPEGPRCYSVCPPGVTGDSVGLGPYVVYGSFVGSMVAGAPPDPGPPAAPVFRAAGRPAAVPSRVVAPPAARPAPAPAARPAERPRPAAPLPPRRVRP
jgi:hypothetical protein